MSDSLQERPLLEQREHAVAILTLNRPAHLNALSMEMMLALIDTLDRLGSDDTVGAIVLTGAGKAFCAGGDVKDMSSSSARGFERHLADLQRVHRIPLLLRTMPKVVIAAVNGYAMGAGLGIAAACDLRVAAASARFATAFAKVGLAGDFGGSYTVQRLVGASQCRELYLTGRTIDADEARRIGLVNSVVSDADVLDAALALARPIAQGPRVAYGYIKRNLLAAETQSFEAVLDLEALHQSRTLLTDDHREAAAAFVEKRPPRFSGR